MRERGQRGGGGLEIVAPGKPTTEGREDSGRLDLLRGHPSDAAVVTDEGSIRYDELARRVAERVADIGAGRRLVLIETRNEVDPLVTYLAALAGGHVALLVAPDTADDLIESYDPDVVLRSAASNLEHRRSGTRHDLHPELALLLSTSGSTGSPKLVRLSRRNLESNAESIARYLALTPSDRAMTTLPFSYCYGLSVINSHLIAGGSIRLSSRSVLEDEFRLHLVRQRALYVRSPRRRGFRGSATSDPALCHPGRGTP